MREAIQEDSFRGFKAKRSESFRMLKRPEDSFLKASLGILIATDVGPVDGREVGLDGTEGRWADLGRVRKRKTQGGKK